MQNPLLPLRFANIVLALFFTFLVNILIVLGIKKRKKESIIYTLPPLSALRFITQVAGVDDCK